MYIDASVEPEYLKSRAEVNEIFNQAHDKAKVYIEELERKFADEKKSQQEISPDKPEN
ncbi:MAG: hypothetical protein HRT89_11490 [Lentisphaeria bacterium]|nr:hypothetical protein [Lentisphaeria bacterium]NQZ68678.1 hypothetical protein [Lentisphaeria bacterium]